MLDITDNMKRLDIPFMFLGPAGVGKTKTLRRMIADANNGTITCPLEQRTFVVGDGYEARVHTSPYHFEIDIPNLSMQDKQIIGDLLTSFFSSGDVLNSLRSSSRKLVILRRAHSLSLAAAIRVRSILHQYVLPPESAGMLWITAREITGPLSILEDAFVRYHIPRTSLDDWMRQVPPAFATALAWEKCEGREERIEEIMKYIPGPVGPQRGLPDTYKWPRRIQDFYDEMIVIMIQNARSGKKPNLQIVQWVRNIVYQSLSFCQTGPEIIDSCAAALQRLFSQNSPANLLEAKVFWPAMKSLTTAEPHTSYRTPLSLESALLFLYETIRTTSEPQKDIPLQNELRASVASEVAVGSAPTPAAETANPALGPPSGTPSEPPKSTPKPRVRKSKKPN